MVRYDGRIKLAAAILSRPDGLEYTPTQLERYLEKHGVEISGEPSVEEANEIIASILNDLVRTIEGKLFGAT